MDNAKCEGHHDHQMCMLVPKAIVLATLMGIGACVRYRRHRRLREGTGVDGGHCGCRHPRRRGSEHSDHSEHAEHHHEGSHHAPHDPSIHPEGPGHAPPRSQPGPIEILEVRFASGEIDEDEFRCRLSVLHENTH